MSLRLLTARGLLALGDAPATRIACVFCGLPAQVVADGKDGLVAACATCTEDALCVAASLADTPGAPT